MPRRPQSVALLAATLWTVVTPASLPTARAQIPSETARAQSESGLTVTCEVFCSNTKLGSSNARIRWSLSDRALATTALKSLSSAKQTLDVSVFYNGLDKGLFVTLPIPAATPDRPIAPLVQAKQATTLPAYQIQIVEVEQPRTTAAADSPSGQMGVVIEGLEPGVNYSWRVAVEAGGARLLSAPVSCQARTCPVDAIAPRDVPRKRP